MYKAWVLGAFLMATGCGGPKLAVYEGSMPSLSIREYFDGPIRAWGIIQDRGGKVVSRFDVKMVGRWEGDVGVLEEDFAFYSGGTLKRVWTITDGGEGRFEGTASDIVGIATGFASGSAGYWRYLMDVRVDSRTFRLRFDDWMWQMNDGVLINRSRMKKFGFTVAELTLFMQKQ